ncbi:MAG: hypothetical protein ACT4NY_04290 [Pseudonocardiales bacterium]
MELFRHRPSLAADLLTGVLGMDLPSYEGVRLEAAECVDLAPAEYRADAVVVLTDAGIPVLVVEVQLTRDRRKWWRWPVYVATLRARLQCPTVLLVVCVDAAVAQWAATPIELGNPGALLPPSVLGPDLIPVVSEAGPAPELVVLSAMAHGGDPARSGVLNVLVGALASVEIGHAGLYAELVLAALPAAARRHLEALMSTHTYEYLSEYAQKFVAQGKVEGKAEGKAEGKVEGKAEGEARAVLAFLEARGIGVPGSAHVRIGACRDLGQLDAWVRRAATIDTIDDLLR